MEYLEKSHFIVFLEEKLYLISINHDVAIKIIFLQEKLQNEISQYNLFVIMSNNVIYIQYNNLYILKKYNV